MTYPKKFFWIYLTTITLFLVGLQHMQTFNKTTRTTFKRHVKKSCMKAERKSFEYRRFSDSKRVIAPLPLSSNLIKHNDFYYSVYNDRSKLSRHSGILKTKVKVGKNGEVVAVRVLGRKGYCSSRKSREIRNITSQRFIPGTVNGQASDFWVNIDFKY